MRKLALAVIVWSFVLACAGPAFAVQNWIIQEVTFDDAELNSNPIKSLEMRAQDPSHFWIMNFEGNATRTAISGPSKGKYGRGAQFDGTTDSRIAITRLNRPNEPETASNANFRFLLWIKPTPPQGYQERQEIFRASNSFAVELKNGEIKIRDEGSNPHVVYSTGKTLSANAFHHLWIEYNAALLNNQMTVSVDFGSAVPVDFGPMAPWVPDGQPPTTGSMGLGFIGVLDELLVTELDGVPTNELRFDRDPLNCPSDLSCAEDSSLTMTPTNWNVDVPVRYKAVWKDTVCNDDHPCPLLVMISGGGACADDYSPINEAAAYAQRRLFVVTVDANCEYGYPWLQLPHETSQLIAAKTHAMANPLFAELILDGDYYATGCSHGAQAVALWLMSETDHPKRAFARSANYAAHCSYHMLLDGPPPQHACTLPHTTLDQVTCGWCDAPSPHDHTDNIDQEGCIEDQWGVINKVTVTSVQQRQLGAIWGAPKPDDETDVCECPGGSCDEASEGNTLGGRLMRDYWRSKEQGSATGWFWEWTSNPNGYCIHCPWDGLNGNIARCSACFLHFGYEDMKTENNCTDCDAMPDGEDAAGACPEPWGLPGGGTNLPCDEQIPGSGTCQQPVRKKGGAASISARRRE